ncbi:DNA/RNA non-specific endonuclease [Actinomadura sp. GC306]|uniref:DNA/RNA non-specific endonuclease n=1 Tax=Actinomadura sp. GC306 TaxID=2530367 RepID=UPI0014046BED|nr:DNA/RNA non-specific endonuclease [Actinomadura sp. GC306]
MRDLRAKAVSDAGSIVSQISLAGAASTAPPAEIHFDSGGAAPPPPTSTATAPEPDRNSVFFPVNPYGSSFLYPEAGTPWEPDPSQGISGGDGDNGCLPFKEYRPLDSQGRATGARAQYCSAGDLAGGSPARKSILPSGWPRDAAGKPNNSKRVFSRGHLIGAQLGGSGSDPRNLITIYQRMNNSSMKKYENIVRRAVEDEGQQVYYEVRPVYSSHAGRPSAVHMLARGNDGLFFNVTIQNSKSRNREHRVIFPWLH